MSSIHKAVSWNPLANIPVIKVNEDTTNRNCIKFNESTLCSENYSPTENEANRGKNLTEAVFV
jgi:hypothetical protein